MAASTDNPVTQFMETVPTRGGEDDEAPEMFLPGLVIHIVPQVNNMMSAPIWRGWPICDVAHGGYRAYVAKRESFKELMVSPSMFLDHLP